MRRLTEQEKEKIINELNPPGSNYKNCNFFKILREEEFFIHVQVGYWITYLNCRPKYEKATICLKK